MTDAQAPATRDDDKLKGWKEIAAFLHSSVRTVQRWERGLHLPVHRIETSSTSIIYASRQELEVWLRTTAGRSAVSECESGGGDEIRVDRDAAAHQADRRRRRGASLAAGVSILLAVAGVGGWLYSAHDRTSASPVAGRASAPQKVPSGTNLRTLFLKITAPGKRPSVVGLTPDSLGMAGMPGGESVGLMPSLVSGRLELHVYRVDGRTLQGQPRLADLSRHWLEPDVPVQLDLPGGRATFEWVSSLSAQPSNPQRGK